MKSLFSTADLYDAFGDHCSSCETQFRQYGARRVVSGKIRTVKCVDDNVLLRGMLESRSDGEVLVVDASGYLGSALMGDTVAKLGLDNGWSGAVINGAVRDADRLSAMAFGVKALGSNPRKSKKHGAGSVDVVVSFGGAALVPGHWLYSDEDGIIVSARKLV
jgi:regulator of ribonuclease activity A